MEHQKITSRRLFFFGGEPNLMWDSPFIMQCSDCHFHGWDMVGLKYIEAIPKRELLIFSTSEIIYPLAMTNSLLLNMAHLVRGFSH
jgi:hypothetical protein